MFFLTVVTHRRQPIFAAPERVACLREALATTRVERPFQIRAAVVLPDHLHFIWELPAGDADFSARVGRMKALFTRALGAVRSPRIPVSSSRRRHREGAVWQRRFWEHTIRDELDYERRMDYVHYNPVKHEVATCPHCWPHSSFLRCVRDGLYTSDWCCVCDGRVVYAPDFGGLKQTVGE